MVKIVFIHVKENFTPVVPLGMLYIGTVLKKEGHNVWVFDINKKEKVESIEKIKSIDPDIIGFSVMTTEYSIAKDFNRDLRKEVPNAYYCWGGIHPSSLPIETIKENNLDFLVYGEGEITMKEVCQIIKCKKRKSSKIGVNLKAVKGVYYVYKGKINKNVPRLLIENLDSLPFPDRSLIEDFKWYLSPPGMLRGKFYYGVTTIFASRGCPYQCIFCSSKTIHGIRIRRRSVKNVIEEISYLKNNFDVKGVYFNDDTFALDKGWLKEFCDSLRKSNLNVIWGCQTRADIAQDMTILKMMKDAGCIQIDIGCESGSDKILKILRKGITSKMILDSFENLRKLKVNTCATFIVGNPGETLEDIRKTEMIAKLAPGVIFFLILVPYPGSPLYKMAIENKWMIDKDIIFDERWTNKQSSIPVMEASFKSDELLRIRSRLQNQFILQNNKGIVLSFLKSPYFLLEIIRTMLLRPKFVLNSVRCSIENGRPMDFLEDIYQKFNEDLRKRG